MKSVSLHISFLLKMKLCGNVYFFPNETLDLPLASVNFSSDLSESYRIFILRSHSLTFLCLCGEEFVEWAVLREKEIKQTSSRVIQRKLQHSVLFTV